MINRKQNNLLSFFFEIDHRLSASKSFDDGLDGDNLDDSKIASALK
jgi:hypothetical protein